MTLCAKSSLKDAAQPALRQVESPTIMTCGPRGTSVTKRAVQAHVCDTTHMLLARGVALHRGLTFQLMKRVSAHTHTSKRDG